MNLAAIQLKIRLAPRSIETQLNLVQDAEKQEATLSSLPKIQANLDQLDEVQNLAQRELDTICQQVIDGDLKDADITTL